MDIFEVEDPKYEHLIAMPDEALPPESAYRFKPERNILD